MKIWSFLVFVGFLLTIACEEPQNSYLKINREHYHFGDTLQLENTAGLAQITFDGKPTHYMIIDSTQFNRGINTIDITAKDNKNNLSKSFNFWVLSQTKEKNLAYNIVETYPHNPALFTQGFLWKDDLLYESSGLYNQSKIVSYTPGSTTFKSKINLEAPYFAEGLTFFKGNFYVLTWKEKTIFKLDSTATQMIEKIDFPSEIQEGWGITNDDHQIYISNGSSTIYILNQAFDIIDKIQIVGYNQSYSHINELEFLDGILYANIWQDSHILKINPKNGEVLGIIDLTEIVAMNDSNSEDVLNGITFSPNQNLMITGKKWHHLYELALQD